MNRNKKKNFPAVDWIRRSGLTRFPWRRDSCDGPTDLVVSFNIHQDLKCQHVASTPNLTM